MFVLILLQLCIHSRRFDLAQGCDGVAHRILRARLTERHRVRVLRAAHHAQPLRRLIEQPRRADVVARRREQAPEVAGGDEGVRVALA